MKNYTELKKYELVYSNNIEENEIRSKESIGQLSMIDIIDIDSILRKGDKTLWIII